MTSPPASSLALRFQSLVEEPALAGAAKPEALAGWTVGELLLQLSGSEPCEPKPPRGLCSGDGGGHPGAAVCAGLCRGPQGLRERAPAHVRVVVVLNFFSDKQRVTLLQEPQLQARLVRVLYVLCCYARDGLLASNREPPRGLGGWFQLLRANVCLPVGSRPCSTQSSSSLARHCACTHGQFGQLL